LLSGAAQYKERENTKKKTIHLNCKLGLKRLTIGGV